MAHSETIPFKGKLPKRFQKFRKYLVDYMDERGDDNGYWLYLVAGWINPNTCTHMVHENTQRECAEQLESIERCTCEECMEYLNA